jgi:hypothetical protein
MTHVLLFSLRTSATLTCNLHENNHVQYKYENEDIEIIFHLIVLLKHTTWWY